MTKFLKPVLLLPVIIFVTGCTTTSPGNFCDVSRSFVPNMTANDVDVISDGFATEIASHEQYGEKVCPRWKR